MKRNIQWPTERHKGLGDHILNVCIENGTGLLLKGSIAKGTAQPYSDIDLSLYGNISKSLIEKVLYGFEKPLMINASEKPPGLLIVAYSRGLALDLGVKRSENSAENGVSMLLVKPSIPGHKLSDPAEEYLNAICRNDPYSKIAKLIHKGLLKYLNGKRDEAGGFIKEIIEFAGMQMNDRPNLIEAFQEIVTVFIREDDVMRQEYCWLIEEAARQYK